MRFYDVCLESQGGRHIDYVADQVVGKLIEVVKKKNKAGVTVKPFQVYLAGIINGDFTGFLPFWELTAYTSFTL